MNTDVSSCNTIYESIRGTVAPCSHNMYDAVTYRRVSVPQVSKTSLRLTTTRSPTLKPLAPSPTASTTPAKDQPMIAGYGMGKREYLPPGKD